MLNLSFLAVRLLKAKLHLAKPTAVLGPTWTVNIRSKQKKMNGAQRQKFSLL